MSTDNSQKFKCLECGGICEPEDYSFGYSGTHCTSGKGGVNHIGYASDCCGADFEEVDADYYKNCRDYQQAQEDAFHQNEI